MNITKYIKYNNLLNNYFVFGGQSKIKLANKNSNWFVISDSTERKYGNSIAKIENTVLGLNFYGELGSITGVNKKKVGFCIAKTYDIKKLKNNYIDGIFFKAVFNENNNLCYLLQLKTSDNKSQESFIAPIQYTSCNNEVFIPLKNFRLNYRGNYIKNEKIDIRNLTSIGIQINRSFQNEPYYSEIPLKFKFTLISNIYAI